MEANATIKQPQKQSPPAAPNTDCRKLGLKCGLEIHQQLNSHKLFCNCPSNIRDDPPHRVIKRRLRAVVGETGKMDRAAALETKKEKFFLYEAYDDTTCLVELDEEPPRPLNEEALTTVLQICKMMGARIVDEIQVMRKTVVDGSNTSGFQRTALVGLDGIIETKDGKVRVPTISIEEDAAKIVQQTPEHVTYNLSKLGIPLVEIGTSPDIKTSEQAMEVAEKIGMILRSTKKVKRGIGTIRQDINISIAGGARIEIKGAQELRMIPLWIEQECVRQKSLLEIREILKIKNTKKELNDEFIDASALFSDCDSKIIKGSLEKGDVVLAMKLSGFAGLVGTEVQPNRRLGTEFSDYAKVHAGVGGIFHSDELPKYGITDRHVARIREKLSCVEHDAFVMVCASKEKATTALEAVLFRARLCFDGVVEEVRKPNPDGTSSFMRPVPGADRMYPETDCVSIAPNIAKIEIPKLIEDERDEIMEEFGLSNDLATALFKKDTQGIGLVGLLRESVADFKNLKPSFMGEAIVSVIPEINRKHKDDPAIDTSRITPGIFKEVFRSLDSGEVPKEMLMEMFIEAARTGKIEFSKYKQLSAAEIEERIRKVVGLNKGAPFNALVGKVMSELRGKADGKLIVDILKNVTGTK